MNKAICVKELEIGSGMPKICVPVMGKTQAGILESARNVVGSGADFAEWRADYFDAVGELQKVEETVSMLRDILQGLPLLFTFRTAKEGGEKEISLEEYERLLLHIADTGMVDMIDVEVFRGYDCPEPGWQQQNSNMAGFSVSDRENERIVRLIQALKKKVAVIGSYHDFQKTPKREEMLARLLFMDRLGVDIPKLAVMPDSREDVLLLLETTSLADRLLPDKPLITMSMGEKGVVSRIAGGQFGSAVTFGCMGRASAPGQIEVGELKKILWTLSCGNKGVFMNLEKHIFLIGFMGVGKTTTSEYLSRKLKAEELDTDRMIVEKEGRSIADIFSSEGEAYFRQAETDLLDELAQREPCIISCGGGMAMREENVARMKQSGTVVFLTATPETIYERVKDCDDRPLLNGNMNIPYIQGLMETREPKYRGAADIVTATDGLAPEQVAEQIILLLQA